MSTSSVWSFTDPDEFTARVRATSMELATTRSGRFAAKMIRIDLNRMWLQRFSDSLPRVAHFNHSPGRAIISFRTHAGPEYYGMARLNRPDWHGTLSVTASFIAQVGRRTWVPCHFQLRTWQLLERLMGEAISRHRKN